jgi:hypothetical protein
LLALGDGFPGRVGGHGEGEGVALVGESWREYNLG